MKDKGLLQGMGELMDVGMKSYVRTNLRSEAIGLLEIYKKYPILCEHN